MATLGRIPRAVAGRSRARRPSPHGRRRLIALAVLAVALGAGYMFWLRDSSLVRVERVTVSGLDTPDAARVRAKLTAAAQHMTTLHVDADALRRAVADEPVVQSLPVQPDFPHGLKDRDRPEPAGGDARGGRPSGRCRARRDAARRLEVGGGLPIVRVGSLPASGRMPAGPARDRVSVAAAAPRSLLSRVESISIQHGRGAVAQLRQGPVIVFGRAVELERKWAAAAAVLAQHSSQGATYIDVRMPERPVAGGLSLEQDPQPQAEAPGAGAAPGSPGVSPAVPARRPRRRRSRSSSPATSARRARARPAADPRHPSDTGGSGSTMTRGLEPTVKRASRVRVKVQAAPTLTLRAKPPTVRHSSALKGPAKPWSFG